MAFQRQLQISDMPAPAPSKALLGREAAGTALSTFSAAAVPPVAAEGGKLTHKGEKGVEEQEGLEGKRQRCLSGGFVG